MTVYPTLLVAAPALQPYRYGLASAAVPASTDDAHWALGVEYEPFGSYLPGVWPGACYVGETSTMNLPDGIGTIVGLPFSVFAGVECKALGYSEDDIRARAKAILDLGWQNAAESALWSGAVGNTPFLTQAGSTVIASGVSMADGIGALEGYMGANYLSNAVIHIPRGGAAKAAAQHQIFERAGKLESAVGSQFVFGGGYPGTGPGGVSAGANNMWIFATGLITVRRSEPQQYGGLEAALNRTTNIETLFYEQPTVLTLDGPIAAVRVDLTK